MEQPKQQRRALFVIDIQNELAKGASTKIPHAERITSAGTSILSAARAINDAHRQKQQTPPFVVVVVQHEQTPEDGALVRGTEPWKLVFEPRPDIDEEWLVAKTTGDTFQSNPDLAGRLRSAGVNEVVAFGIQSDCCVELTCNGAVDASFRVTLLSGAHSTYDYNGETALEIERNVEKRLLARGAEIVQWDEVVPKWATPLQL